MEIAIIFTTLAAAPLAILVGIRAIYFLARVAVCVLTNLPRAFTDIVPTWEEIVAAYVNTVQFFTHTPSDPVEDLPDDDAADDTNNDREVVLASAKNEIELTLYSNWLGVDVDKQISATKIAKIDALVGRLNNLGIGQFQREGASIRLYRQWNDHITSSVNLCIKLYSGEYVARHDLHDVTIIYFINTPEAEEELCQFILKVMGEGSARFSANLDYTGVHYIPGGAVRKSPYNFMSVKKQSPKELQKNPQPTYGLITDMRDAGFECKYVDGAYVVVNAPHITIIVGKNDKLYQSLTAYDTKFTGTRVVIEFIPTGERGENDRVVDLVRKYANFRVPGIWVLHVPDA